MYYELFSIISLICLIVVVIWLISMSNSLKNGKSYARGGKRFRAFVAFNGDVQKMYAELVAFLDKNGYHLFSYGDERVFKSDKGGIFTKISPPRYIKIIPNQSDFSFEAWYIGGNMGPEEVAFNTLDGSKEAKFKQLIKHCLDMVFASNQTNEQKRY